MEWTEQGQNMRVCLSVCAAWEIDQLSKQIEASVRVRVRVGACACARVCTDRQNPERIQNPEEAGRSIKIP